MKKIHLVKRATQASVSLIALGGFLLVSCADHYDGNESWSSSVQNQLLESPSTDVINITKSPDGSKTNISWPVVFGAGGYHAVVTNINDPNNVVVLKNDTIDGCSFEISREEDTNYMLSLRTIGSEQLGNKTAETATEKKFTSYEPTFAKIPADYNGGKNQVKKWIQDNIRRDTVGVLNIDLEPGKEYVFDEDIDLDTLCITLRSESKEIKPIFKMSKGARFIVQRGFILKNVLIDFTDVDEGNGLVCLSKTPTTTAPEGAVWRVKKNQEVYEDAAVKDFNLIEESEPISITGCVIKNLTRALITTNNQDWAVGNVIIRNNIIQLDIDGTEGHSYGVIQFDKAANNKAAIRNFTFEYNTIYNLAKNSTNYFFRLANESNARGAFGTKNGTSTYTYTLSYNTIIRTYTNKDFGNNVFQIAACSNTVSNNIFYDVYRVNKYLHNNQKTKTLNNFIFFDETPVQNDDINKTDSDGNPYTTKLEEKPFTIPTTALDLTLPNGGLNLTPSGPAADKKAGDPRWY